MRVPETGEEFAAWRERMAYTIRRAARALGCAKQSIQDWEKMDSIPHYIGLACFAIETNCDPRRNKHTFRRTVSDPSSVYVCEICAEAVPRKQASAE